MVYYEVEMMVEDTIKQDFLLWLSDHMAHMLKIEGFESAELYQKLNEYPSKMMARYQLKDKASLHNYFEQHATKMRDQLPLEWVDYISFHRRVLVPEFGL
jgi:quinol monooxygenase YgiN